MIRNKKFVIILVVLFVVALMGCTINNQSDSSGNAGESVSADGSEEEGGFLPKTHSGAVQSSVTNLDGTASDANLSSEDELVGPVKRPIFFQQASGTGTGEQESFRGEVNGH